MVQAVCQNHPECGYWSHWREEHGEHWGSCTLHYNCDTTTSHECHQDCLMRPPGPRCSCMYGTPLPDLGTEHHVANSMDGSIDCASTNLHNALDACDDGEVHLPCEDDFWHGTRCEGGPENELMHVTQVGTRDT